MTNAVSSPVPYVLTPDVLQKCFPNASKQKVLLYVDELNRIFQQYEINTLPRIRMFLTQLGHESGELRYVRELATGKAYEGRRDLGNTQPGDGEKYRGRGLIQLTGKRNYALCGLALDLPLLEKPELLEEPAHAVSSSAWFWKNANLSYFADRDDFRGMSYRINGGREGRPKDPNGWAHRVQLYQRCLKYIV